VIPEDLVCLHVCDHPWCVRPSHLVIGSQAANLFDMAWKGRASTAAVSVAVVDGPLALPRH
jgi:Zinc-binding loop region of homing endonuclease